jgi:hypothetical protein
MKLILFLFLLSNTTYGKSSNLKMKGFDYKKAHNTEVQIEGIITELKHHIRSRSNFYTFTLNVDNHSDSIEVKLYTINWLKRANFFTCEDGDVFSGKIPFNYKPSRGVVGKVVIKQLNKSLKCEKEDPETKIKINVKP